MNLIASLFRRAHALLKQAGTQAMGVAERLARSAIAYRIHARIAVLQGRTGAARQYLAVAEGYALQALQKGYSRKEFAL